jgi:hypothetical protein
VFENRVLRRILSPRKVRELRKLHNEELNNLNSSPTNARMTKLSRMRWSRHVASRGERRGVYRVLVRIHEGKRPTGRSRCRLEDNIKMDLEEVRCGGMEWTRLAEYRDRWRALVNTVMKFRVA